jgi:hypothetical protein
MHITLQEVKSILFFIFIVFVLNQYTTHIKQGKVLCFVLAVVGDTSGDYVIKCVHRSRNHILERCISVQHPPCMYALTKLLIFVDICITCIRERLL